jgi:hypothetical protein
MDIEAKEGKNLAKVWTDALTRLKETAETR